MQVRQKYFGEKAKVNVDNFVEMVDLSDKLVQKFSTKSMFERKELAEKLQKSMTCGKRGQDVM